MARDLVVRIIGDASSLERAMVKSTRSAKRFQGSMKTARLSVTGFQRSLTGLTAGLLGGAGLVVALRAVAHEASEMQKVQAQTNAVIESTGGVAGVTAEHVEELGKTLMALSGVDDEVIKSSENLLLTFRNIRNVVGEGNDIFDQAALAALNLSVRFGRDLPGATIMLAKALQEPLTGLTALRRAGVQFSVSQVKTIKALVASGRLLEAQKIILAEVEAQTRGAAEAAGDTLAGKLNKLRENALNLGGTLATTLLPVIEPLVDQMIAWFQNTKNQQQVMRDFRDVVAVLGSVLRTLRDAFAALNEITGSTRTTLKLLLGVFLAYKAAKIIGTLAGIAGNIGLIGRNAKTATPLVRGLSLALSTIGVGAVAAAGAALLVMQQKVQKAFEDVRKTQEQTIRGQGAETTLVPALAKQIAAMKKAGKTGMEIIAALRKQLGGSLKADDLIAEAFAFHTGSGPARERIRKQVRERAQKVADAARQGAAEAPGVADPEIAKRAAKQSREAREAFRQEMQERAAFAVERAGATKTLADDLAALNRYNALLERRMRGGHRTLELEREQFGVQQQIADVLRQQAEQVKEAARLRREAQAQARETRQFRALGLGPGGEELVPGVQALRKRLGRAADAIKGTFLDTSKTRGILNAIRKVLSGGLGSVGKDVRARIEEILRELGVRLDEGLAEQREKAKKTHEAIAATVSKIGALQMFADLRQFGGNVWTRVPGGGGTGAGTPSGRGPTQVVVNQHFNAPTTDRHREARYAAMAARTVFDG